MSEKMKVTPFLIRDTQLPSQLGIAANIPFEEAQNNDELRNNWFHPVCSRFNPVDNLLYIGNTAYNNDILYTFDPQNKTFTSLGFQRIASRYDAKVHRSLEIDHNGIIYGATASLHDLDAQHIAPGGQIFQYDPKTRELTTLAIPVPPWYIQTIVLDPDRMILYGYTYQAPYLFRFDIPTRETTVLAYTGNDGHNLALDKDGNLWAYWRQHYGTSSTLDSSPQTTMLKYQPDTRELTWLKNVGVPGRFENDWVYVDFALLGDENNIYIGTTAGTLFSFCTNDQQFQYLGTPLLKDSRIGGMTIGKDGNLYIAAGRNYRCHLVRYLRPENIFEDLGEIKDLSTGEACCDTHFITETSPGTFYISETDNLRRSSYLWECCLE
ncbi:MAG: hypothetical protein ACOYKH_05355 [Brevefilum fermentans]|jgi:hypothetical protein|uniref:Uncharacterized protein n=1 Tax=Candidatus Brevifilum fermentans TaxID=1986204 RepID=A0A1Y6K0S0_9CHLR|nr:hypothetical protein [Brevefilum fermentans]SMX53166.1 protein of unknown function [Brevefilum fermentans]